MLRIRMYSQVTIYLQINKISMLGFQSHTVEHV